MEMDDTDSDDDDDDDDDYEMRMAKLKRMKDEKFKELDPSQQLRYKRKARHAFDINEYDVPQSPSKDHRTSLDQATKHRSYPTEYLFFSTPNPPNVSNPSALNRIPPIHVQISSVYHMYNS